MKDYTLYVVAKKSLSLDVFELKLYCKEALPDVKAGQFLNLECGLEGAILRRPFCICKQEGQVITLLIKVLGRGTKNLQNIMLGTPLKAIMPLGNGFDLQPKHKKVALVCGGLGAAPLLMNTKIYSDKQFFAYMGFSDASQIVLEEEYKAACEQVTICTDDGSNGKRGFATQAFERDYFRIRPDVLLVCGPEPMLKEAQRICNKFRLQGFMTGEARMACGVGACLVCACKHVDENGQESMLRACCDGPVFELDKVVL